MLFAGRVVRGWLVDGLAIRGLVRGVEVLAVASRLNTLVHHVDYGWSVGRVWCIADGRYVIK